MVEALNPGPPDCNTSALDHSATLLLMPVGKVKIKPLKESDLGVAGALFDS